MELNLDPIDLSPKFQRNIPEGKPGERSGLDQNIPTSAVEAHMFPVPIQAAIQATLVAGGNVTFYSWHDSPSGGTGRYKSIHK